MPDHHPTLFCRHYLPRPVRHQMMGLSVLICVAQIARMVIVIRQRGRNNLIIAKMVAAKRAADAEMGKEE